MAEQKLSGTTTKKLEGKTSTKKGSQKVKEEEITAPLTVVKRDGRKDPFDLSRIENAIFRCFRGMERAEESSEKQAKIIANKVFNIVSAKFDVPTVESIQDIVEMVLQSEGEYEAAKRYILYRAEHAKMRMERPVPDEVRAAFERSDEYFPEQLQKFQFYDKYSRFSWELGRRETWIETVDRAVNFLRELSDFRLSENTYKRIRKGILEMKVMPSMRLLAMAGPAARRNNISLYNCSYLPVDSIQSFVESMIISMSGCGVGFSVESEYVEKFPRIKRQKGEAPINFVIEDSTEGWGEALKVGLEAWFEGRDVHFNYSLIRPAGAVLRVKGGRASGPEPLRQMMEFSRARILARQGSFLRSIDAHDIMCAVGQAAVSGGVRRTAMISLFDYDDHEMRHCKDGDFWIQNSQRWNANNSAVWPSRKLTQAEVASYILDMVNSQRGEPGIFNRQAAVDTKPERRKIARFGTNPCGEIILRPFQFCNLTAAVAREGTSDPAAAAPEQSAEALADAVAPDGSAQAADELEAAEPEGSAAPAGDASEFKVAAAGKAKAKPKSEPSSKDKKSDKKAKASEKSGKAASKAKTVRTINLQDDAPATKKTKKKTKAEAKKAKTKKKAKKKK